MRNSFWSSELFESYDRVALATSDASLTYSDLNHMVNEYCGYLSTLDLQGKVAFLPMKTDVCSVVRYLACLREAIVPLLLPEKLDSSLELNLRDVYEPAISFGLSGLHDIELHAISDTDSTIAKDLAILLSTSGSTGSAKLVKLSQYNLQENASSICSYLNIKQKDKAHCALPLSYSYGLSVLNSHLHAGACIYLSELSPFSEGYYEELAENNITSISGVPFYYQMLSRTGFFEKSLPSLEVMTQAGGKLGDNLVRKFNEYAENHGSRFFVMYGQTEATARISYVPPERLSQKIGSIGIAIPGGTLELSDAGELLYSGPNVMMGYAESRDDLLSEGEAMNVLATGDLGKVDGDGYFYITGRLKRFVKLAGSRYGLDEIEQALEDDLQMPLLVIGKDEKLMVFAMGTDLDKNEVVIKIQEKFQINRSFIKVTLVDRLARKANGKKDYAYYRDE